MQETLLLIIAIALVILTIELSIVLYYTIVFLREAIVIARKVKELEGTVEQKMEKMEADLTIFGAKLARVIARGLGKFFKR